MKRHATKAALGLFVMLAIGVPVFAIVGGELDTANEFSNVGAILITKTPASQPGVVTPQTISSATLIHPRIVMTAGHSVALIRNLIKRNADIELSDFAVVFVPDAHDGTGTEYGIADTLIHDGFTDFDVKAARDATSIDVGLLILTEAVVGIKPVDLPEAAFLDELDLDRGTSESKPDFIIVGYGNTVVPSKTAPATLPSGKRRFAFSTFRSLRAPYLMLSQQFSLGEGGLARGDSGGAAFWEMEDGSLIQVGVSTNGDHSSVSYGAHVRTDQQTVINFIQDAIDGLAG